MKRKTKLGQYLNENKWGNIPEDFLEETAPLIWYIVQDFNLLDERLNEIICEFISSRSHHIWAAVIYKMHFTAKVDLFYRLRREMELGIGWEIPILKSLVEDMKKCAILRNAVIHAEWENTDEENFTFINLNFNSENWMHQQYEQFTPETLEKIDDFINETLEKSYTFEEQETEFLRR